MLVANQIDLKMPKRKIKAAKSNNEYSNKYDYPVIEKELIPTNGTLLSIRQMKEGKVMPFDSVKEMMEWVG